MKLFLGEYDHVLDDRGRITLPRKIRQELSGETIVLSRGFDECIFGFDRESWEREAEKHLAGNLTDPKSREIRRYLFAAAENVEIDRLGRILLPAQLKEYAHIGKDIVVVGAGDHFEVWEKKLWERQSVTMNPS
jgi:MraZ protein